MPAPPFDPHAMHIRAQGIAGITCRHIGIAEAMPTARVPICRANTPISDRLGKSFPERARPHGPNGRLPKQDRNACD